MAPEAFDAEAEALMKVSARTTGLVGGLADAQNHIESSFDLTRAADTLVERHRGGIGQLGCPEPWPPGGAKVSVPMNHLLKDLRESNPREVLRAVKSGLDDVFARPVPLTAEDEAALAHEADVERGYHLSLRERSKRAHELAESAPVVRYAVPRLNL